MSRERTDERTDDVCLNERIDTKATKRIEARREDSAHDLHIILLEWRNLEFLELV